MRLVDAIVAFNKYDAEFGVLSEAKVIVQGQIDNAIHPRCPIITGAALVRCFKGYVAALNNKLGIVDERSNGGGGTTRSELTAHNSLKGTCDRRLEPGLIVADGRLKTECGVKAGGTLRGGDMLERDVLVSEELISGCIHPVHGFKAPHDRRALNGARLFARLSIKLGLNEG